MKFYTRPRRTPQVIIVSLIDIFAILLIFVMTKAIRAVNWGRLARGRPKYGGGLVKPAEPALAQPSPPAGAAPAQPSPETSPQESQQRESGVGQ